MNKLKVAIEELKTHLGRDERGHGLLSAVTTIANQQRKDLAAAVEQKTGAEKARAIAMSDLSKSESTVESLRQDVARLQSVCGQRDREIMSLQADVTTMQSRIDELLPDDLPELDRTERVTVRSANKYRDPSLVDDLSPIVAMFNRVRKDMRVAPPPVDVKGILVSKRRAGDCLYFHAFEITDIIKNLSPSELMKLGGFVACRALFNFPCIIQAATVVQDAYDGKKLPDNVIGPFVVWMRRHMAKNTQPFVTDDGRLEI